MSSYDLFDNPMVRNAIKALSPEERERYKKMGEQFYKDIDFAAYQPNVMPQELKDTLARATEGLKSGLHPTILDEGEVKLLEEAYGLFWYKKFGWETDDMRKKLS